jgi:hypothetical protein
MWLTDLEVAVKDIAKYCNECRIKKITPCWNGGIAFHLSNHTTLLWNIDHTIKIKMNGEWRNK